MLFEGIVIIATWARTIGVLRMLRKGNAERGRGVTYLMLRDGKSGSGRRAWLFVTAGVVWKLTMIFCWCVYRFGVLCVSIVGL